MELSLGALMRAPRGNVGYGGRGARARCIPAGTVGVGRDVGRGRDGDAARSLARGGEIAVVDGYRPGGGSASVASRARRASRVGTSPIAWNPRRASAPY